MLRREIYAVASLLGAVVVAVGERLAAPDGPLLLAAAALTCLVRVVALRRGWSAPRARADLEPPPTER